MRKKFHLFPKKPWRNRPSVLQWRQNKKGGVVRPITIDPSRCIGCGMCAYTAPGVFRIVGKYSTVVAPPEKTQEFKAFDAANGCPVNAIDIRR